ncbi:unnamed protein product [Periconia digitata]|uniref:RING-type domain-containing protein n=1 Tax=Periconia digitata TaxID=1303443 RepID=A0A9W4UM57_9PLEO|nr:unnamed protein product [Periconia digitata]
MSSVFSSLIRPAKTRQTSSSQHASDDVGLSPQTPLECETDSHLSELNTSLQALADIFPDVQAEVFREMLSSFSPGSRLQVVTEQILKHGNKWVRGRYRMPAEQEGHQAAMVAQYKYRKTNVEKDTRGIPLAPQDKFRSASYKDAAKEALYLEFKGLSHSTIKAVLAEWNWSYTDARPTLLQLSSNSWRTSITNFLMRRKTPTATDHPLVVWLAPEFKSGRGKRPLLVKTKSAELDQELYETLIVPELEKQRKEQVQQDFDLALQWNEEEAEKEGEMYDCECCFIPNTLQQMSTCDVNGHYICFRCIGHAINAALYDQGWARNINSDLCTLKCIVPLPNSADDCRGCVPMPLVQRALLAEKDGEDTLKKLHERFTSEALTQSRLPLIQCPFCSYAEIDDLALPATNLLSGLHIKRRRLLLASLPFFELLCFQAARAVFSSLILLFSILALTSYILPSLSLFTTLSTPFKTALRRIHLKRRGLRFQCLSPTCARASCLTCAAPWHDPHKCYSSQLTSLRLALERATTDAIKRTCPVCNLSFVKSDGCNKLVCLCGYSMCYICRKGLKVEGYAHFCQHFRAIPGQACTECQKCDLYRVEDEERVVARARESAEKEWWGLQGDGAGGDGQGEKSEAGKMKLGEKAGKNRHGLKEVVGKKRPLVGSGESKARLWRVRWVDVEGWIERAVESVVV